MIEFTFALIAIIVTGITMKASHPKSARIEFARDGHSKVNKAQSFGLYKLK